MKIVQFFSAVAVGLVSAFATDARASTCTWDGGGADDMLTTAANWVGDTAPVAGDILVFQGETRTTPVNDVPAGTEFTMIRFANDGSSGKTAGFTLDLNGCDLTVGSICNVEAVSGATPAQVIKSDMPCTLTVSSDADSVTARGNGDLQGGITLVKKGAGNWTTCERNSTMGDVVVAEGTLTLAADDVLPQTSEISRLTIRPGACVCVTNGTDGVAVTAKVPRLTLGDTPMRRGIYGGEGCSVSGAQILPDYFAPGKGAVVVTGGEGNGLVLTFRLNE